jgi:hypothetical protein
MALAAVYGTLHRYWELRFHYDHKLGDMLKVCSPEENELCVAWLRWSGAIPEGS